MSITWASIHTDEETVIKFEQGAASSAEPYWTLKIGDSAIFLSREKAEEISKVIDDGLPIPVEPIHGEAL